jgi:hypothetical protein
MADQLVRASSYIFTTSAPRRSAAHPAANQRGVQRAQRPNPPTLRSRAHAPTCGDSRQRACAVPWPPCAVDQGWLKSGPQKPTPHRTLFPIIPRCSRPARSDSRWRRPAWPCCCCRAWRPPPRRPVGVQRAPPAHIGSCTAARCLGGRLTIRATMNDTATRRPARAEPPRRRLARAATQRDLDAAQGALGAQPQLPEFAGARYQAQARAAARRMLDRSLLLVDGAACKCRRISITGSSHITRFIAGNCLNGVCANVVPTGALWPGVQGGVCEGRYQNTYYILSTKSVGVNNNRASACFAAAASPPPAPSPPSPPPPPALCAPGTYFEGVNTTDCSPCPVNT